MKTRALAAVLAVVGMTLSHDAASAQQSGSFVITQNDSQIATETFTRTASQLETELSVTGQGTIATTATLGENATVTRLELRILPPGSPDAEPIQSIAAEFRADSVHVEQPIGTVSGSAPASGGVVPFVSTSPSYMGQILRRARAMGGDEVTVQIWVPGQGAGQVLPVGVTVGEESGATLTLGAATVELETDDEGNIVGAEVPAQNLVIERQ